MLLRGTGKLIIGAATLGIMAGVSLFLVGTYVLTFPVLRKSPKARKLRATVDLASALVTTLAVFERDLDAAKADSVKSA